MSSFASAYEIDAPVTDPGEAPAAVREQAQRNAVNAQRQDVADRQVRSVVDGLKLAAVNARAEALPHTRALAQRMTASGGAGEALANLASYAG